MSLYELMAFHEYISHILLLSFLLSSLHIRVYYKYIVFHKGVSRSTEECHGAPGGYKEV